MGFGGWGDAGREVVKAGVSSDQQGRASEHTSPWATTTTTSLGGQPCQLQGAGSSHIDKTVLLLGVAEAKHQVDAHPFHIMWESKLRISKYG